MRVTARYGNHDHLRFYEPSTHETVAPLSEVVFTQDFINQHAGAITPAGEGWDGLPFVAKRVGNALVNILVDQPNGVAQLSLTMADEKQDGVLYQNDQRAFSAGYDCVFEAIIRVAVTPTLVAEAVWGLAYNWIDGPDNNVNHAMFTVDGSTAIRAMSDDGTNDVEAATSLTALTTVWNTYRIESVVSGGVRQWLFYVNGNAVATATTFTFAATGDNLVLQPYVGVYKASGAGVCTIDVDVIRCWQHRS